MIYKVEFSDKAFKEFGKLDIYTQKFFYAWIQKRLVNNENPRSIGKGIARNKSGQWRYRIGDYRLLCLIEDDKLIILVLSLGYRSNVYK